MQDNQQHWPFLGGATSRVDFAEGAWITLKDGRRILDAAGGAIVANVGLSLIHI